MLVSSNDDDEDVLPSGRLIKVDYNQYKKMQSINQEIRKFIINYS